MCFNGLIKSDCTVLVIKNMLKVPFPGNDISVCEGLLQLRSRGNNQTKKNDQLRIISHSSKDSSEVIRGTSEDRPGNPCPSYPVAIRQKAKDRTKLQGGPIKHTSLH